MINRQQDITRMDGERLAAHRCEFQYASQRKHILRDRIIVPVKRGMRRRFFEEDGFRLDQCTAAYTTTFHVGISVRTSIETKRSDHTVTLSFSVMLFNTAAVWARTRRQSAGFSERD